MLYPLLNGGLGLTLKSCAYGTPKDLLLWFFRFRKNSISKSPLSNCPLPIVCFPWENQCFLLGVACFQAGSPLLNFLCPMASLPCSPYQPAPSPDDSLNTFFYCTAAPNLLSILQDPGSAAFQSLNPPGPC